MHKIMIAVLATAIAGFAVPGAANAAVCKDAKGKFIKCQPVMVAKPGPVHVVEKKSMFTHTVTTTKPVMMVGGGVYKDKSGRCHVGSGPKKGQFTKC